MIEIIFLGTAGAVPSIKRSLISTLLIYQGHKFLIDCGEGTQRRLMQAGRGWSGLDNILISHSHLDHISGLPGFFTTLAMMHTDIYPKLYASEASRKRIEKLLDLAEIKPESGYSINPIVPGVIHRDKDWSLEAFSTKHSKDSLGFIFRKKAKPVFLVEKAEALGIPEGPLRKQLVNGETITLAEGKIITPEQVLGPAQGGISIAFLTDTGICEEIIAAVEGVDCLISEASFLEEEKARAEEYGHLTAQQAAEIAKKAKVKNLVLTHISSRYNNDKPKQEAEAIFSPCYLAKDLWGIKIDKYGEIIAFAPANKLIS